MTVIPKVEEEVDTDEETKNLTAPLIQDSKYNNSDKTFKVFYYGIIPSICGIIFLVMGYLSFKFKHPSYLFYSLIVMWLFILYPVYY